MRVSLPQTAEGGRIRVALAALCAVAAVMAAAWSPPAAHAAFSLKRCEGSTVQGEGSSFQRVAQAQLELVFTSPFGCGEGAALTSPVTYFSDGSGCGIASMGGGPSTGKCSDFESASAANGYRDANSRFGGSDAPLTPAQEEAANATSSGKPGLLHTLPIADGATAVIVHFPAGCQLENPAQTGGNANTTTGGFPVPEAKAGEVKAGEEDRNNDPAGKYTGDTYAEGTLRAHIPAETLEKIWDGTPMTWGEVLKTHITGTPTGALEAEESFTTCASIPVRRIVRFDGSGTTYNYKAYLALLPGAQPAGVFEKSPVVGDNTTWPLTTSATGVPKAVPNKEEALKKEFPNECNAEVSGPARICTGAANGGGSVAAAVAATDGSIGYADLATARQNGFTITKNSKAIAEPAKDDLTYWIPLQTINPSKGNEVGTNYVEPTSATKSHIESSGEPNGSNCTHADYRGIPTTPASDPTLGNWSAAIATGSEDTATYPNCALTYDFVWDDDAPVYGNTPAEEAKARTVRDYFTTVESEGGQLSLTAADYGSLSPEIIAVARTGVEAIGWNKAAGSGGGKEEAKTPPKEEKAPVITPIVTPPSNAFSIAGAKVKGKTILLSLVLPGAGKVQIKAIGAKLTVANVTASVSGGKGSVTLSLSRAALSKLAKIKGHKFSVKITITFTPTGGSKASKSKTLTLTQAAIKGKK